MKHLKGKRFKCVGCNTRIPQKTVAGYYSVGFGLYNIPCSSCGQHLIKEKEEYERIEYEQSQILKEIERWKSSN